LIFVRDAEQFTALPVPMECAPDFVPVAVPHAMALIDGRAVRAG
jgi:hypothetical protein